MGHIRRGYNSPIVKRVLRREKDIARYIEHRTDETGTIDEDTLKIQIDAFRTGWNTCFNTAKKYKPKVDKKYEKAFLKSIDDEIEGFKDIDDVVEKMLKKRE